MDTSSPAGLGIQTIYLKKCFKCKLFKLLAMWEVLMACMNFEEVFQDVLTIKGSLLHTKGASSLSLHLTERTCPML